jgi:hypothetical protein
MKRNKYRDIAAQERAKTKEIHSWKKRQRNSKINELDLELWIRSSRLWMRSSPELWMRSSRVVDEI